MKTQKSALSIALISSVLAAALMTGCGKADVTLSIQGTTPSSSTMQRLASWFLLEDAAIEPVASAVPTTASIPVIGANGSQLGVLLLTDARVALKDIKFEQEGKHDASSTEYSFRGPYVVNLITNAIAPTLDSVVLPDGKYDEVELKLHKIQGGEKNSDSQVIPTTDALFGNSIYVAGSYTATGGSAIPFAMSFDFDEKFELTGEGAVSQGIEVLKGNATPVIIAFRLAKWFDFSSTKTNSDRVDFASMALGSSVTLDSRSEGTLSKLRSVIKENIKKSADYGKDSDGDGKLSSSEDDDADTDDSRDQ